MNPQEPSLKNTTATGVRTGTTVEALRQAIEDNRHCVVGRAPEAATAQDNYIALAYTVRDRLLERFIRSAQAYRVTRARTVCYLSAEFLIGPQLGNNIVNLGIWDQVEQAVSELGLPLDELLAQEPEPGLGTGGLGRLAACYMDSLSSCQIPAIGYGIRYEYGIFDQKIEDGWQVEVTDAWLRNGYPWELFRPKLRFPVKFGGHTETYRDDDRLRVRWVPETVVYGVAYDTPILGYGVSNVNLLRLWKSEAREAFNFQAFNTGDYYGAVHDMVAAENLSKVLYPNDEPEAGKELRLKQQAFFASCSLQDMIRMHLREHDSLSNFDEKFAIQLNDTHPAISVAELMRLLIDEHQFEWERAWEITCRSFAYTNHTLLPEALETWPLPLFRRILPRHMEIIFEINSRFLDEARMRYLHDPARIARLSIIDDAGDKRVRMANLACVAASAINGVARIHSELLKETVLSDFHDLWPEKFQNKTNGVSPRRFISLSNHRFARLLDETVGGDWLHDMDRLTALEDHAADPGFHENWQRVKLAAKERLAGFIRERTGVVVDPKSMFDIQAKRIHEYKRQHLNVLHILTLYHRLKQNPGLEITPRTFIFGGKAAPGYQMAKLIIKFINAVADVINRDMQVRDFIKVVFVPDFNVTTAQVIYPAADLSEQISTAGKEASGTGNMKFTMNGALTVGTLDGANVEIRERVGAENFFLFGLTAQQVMETEAGGYNPGNILHGSDELRAIFDLVSSGLFSHGDGRLFAPLIDNLTYSDPYLVLADYAAYIACQEDVGNRFLDHAHWTTMAIRNVARCGYFSSDRAIREYAADIWRVQPLPV